MIYVLGMSHAVNVLKAVSAEPLSFSIDNFAPLLTNSQFFDIPAKPGLIPGDLLKAFVITGERGWGNVAELHTQENAQWQVVANEDFITLLRSLETVQDDGLLFSFVHGNEHTMLSLVQHTHPYDFDLPGRLDLGLLSDSQPVPYEIVHRQTERALGPTIACLAAIRVYLPHIRLVHVMPPPPLESEQKIMQAPEIFREQFARHGITPFSLRLKYHLLACQILQEALIPFNVSLLTCPPQAISASGAIKDEYACGTTHGNEAYGLLVIEQMQALASKD